MPSRLIIFLLLLSFGAHAQTATDTAVLDIDAFSRRILNHHPVALQAQLLSEQAKQEIRMARGSFDPKLDASWATKEFESKNYFNTFNGSLSLPTRSPVTPKVGFEQRTGQLLDPSEKIPGNRQVSAGISVPLGRGLLTDERRTALRQAGLMTTMLEAERVKVINKLLLEGAVTYWNWYYRYQSFLLYDRAAGVAQELFNRAKLNYRQGEASVLDTVQASITWQMRMVERQEALMQVQNARIAVSNFIWDEGLQPLDLQENAIPTLAEADRRIDTEELGRLTELAMENHPELIKLRTKIDQLELEETLAREFLKPRLDLNYFMLRQPSTPGFFDPKNDYKMGMDFSMPLFLRKERAKLRMTGLKIDNSTFELNQEQRDIRNDIRKIFNELVNVTAILGRQQEMAASYQKLMDGEMLNLQNGESDLFKINIQQEKLLQANEKVIKLQAEYRKQKAYLYWAAGVSPALLRQ